MASASVFKNVNRRVSADDELLRNLYSTYGTSLLSYATRLLGGDQQRAEDIVQETLLRAWRKPEPLALDGDRSVRAWLFTVTRNLVIDSVRARDSRPPESFNELADTMGSHDGGLDSALTRFEVLEALESLGSQHRDVVIELYFLDRSIAQAAQSLGVPEGTIKSRCHYALRALRVLCQERGLLP
jgi:RNA polymerase sigma-70 factor (ECF subfamily)